MKAETTIIENAELYDVKKIREDFPILKRKVNGKPLVYLDNAATSQKPQQVIDALTEYYSMHNANIHRGVHRLSEEATQLFEDSHKTVSDFINADFEEVIFTKNCTESINLVAYSYGFANLKKGDEIIISKMEHHSNFVPWQQIAKFTGSTLKFADLDAKDFSFEIVGENWGQSKGGRRRGELRSQIVIN